MKFWKKVFLYSVILFLILENSAGILLIQRNFEENLKDAIKAAMDKYSDIEYSLYLNVDYLIDVDVEDKESIKRWMDIIIYGYSVGDNTTPFNIEMYSKDNELIMSSMKLSILAPRPELTNIQSGQKKFIIRKIEGKRYVFISELINIKNAEFKLILSRDINRVYDKQKEDYKFFFMTEGILTLILGIGMYIISKHLTRPIERLSQTSKEIAEGDYSKRVIESGRRDEVGILEKNFNSMLEAMEQNITQLSYMNESKQRFIDSLNHEIKTPITSIIGYSELLLRSKVNEETRIKALMYINSEAKRLEMINTALLKLILSREGKVNRQRISLPSCLMSAVQTLRYKIEQQQIQLEIHMEEMYIYADKHQVEVLLTNLIDNAVKAFEAKGTIMIYTEGETTLIIQDDGLGIPGEDLDKILEPFYVVDKARTRKQNGIGLGLAICQEICTHNDIQMKIVSEKGCGTKVILQFHKGVSS